MFSGFNILKIIRNHVKRNSADFFKRIKLRYLKSSISVIFFATLLGYGYECYVGSKFTYLYFSLIYFFVLINGLVNPISFGYQFLSIFLWLGFWFKLSINFFISGYFPNGEPIGLFDNSPSAWDEVLIYASILGLGLLSVRLLFFRSRQFNLGQCRNWAAAPTWYLPIRGVIWGLALVAILLISVINHIYAIHLIGLVPKMLLIWPLNGFIAWFLNWGGLLTLAVLTCWDVSLRLKLGFSLYAFLGEAFLSATSIMSRAMFQLHILPELFVFWKAGLISKFSLLQKGFYIIIIFATFFCSIYLVSVMRGYYYQNNNPPNIYIYLIDKIFSNKFEKDDAYLLPNAESGLIHKLFINRWIGLEGLMVVTSHRERGAPLLWDMLIEKRENGIPTKYQEISNSNYQKVSPKYQFGTIPGIGGFLAYGNSLSIVFISIFIIGIFSILTEKLLYRMTENSIVSSIYGIYIANSIAQFGVTPRQEIVTFLMFFLFASLVWLIQVKSEGIGCRKAV